MAFIKDHYLHGKSVLALGESESLINAAELPRKLPNGDPDPGLIVGGNTAVAAGQFIKALAKRYPERIEPPVLA